MAVRTDFGTIVIGAGQAGLAAGYYLAKTGRPFLVVDGGSRIGESWRRRWDSLRLFTPARYNGLPGMRFPGDPDALPGKDQVANYLEAYASEFKIPVELGIQVRSIKRNGKGFVVRTENDELNARSIIVATGAYQRPFIPPITSEVSEGIFQIHSSRYRNPTQLPAGDVLVVGAGNSGAQIALELAATRNVWLSGPDTGSISRRVLGRDVYRWLWPTLLQVPVRLIGHTSRRLFAGDPLIGISARDLNGPTLTRVGRTVQTRDGLPVIDDGRILNVATIVWCTGFRPDFGWINLPVFGKDGYPIHHRGLVPQSPGLAFVGLRYQYRISSSLIGGVGKDAEFVVSALCRA